MNSLHLHMYEVGKLSQASILAFYPAETVTTLLVKQTANKVREGKA